MKIKNKTILLKIYKTQILKKSLYQFLKRKKIYLNNKIHIFKIMKKNIYKMVKNKIKTYI